MKANSGASTSFVITPRNIGYISIKVSATSPLAGDAVDRKLLVKAEGETQYVNKAIFVDLRSESNFKKNITLDIPANIVQGSEQIEVSAVGKFKQHRSRTNFQVSTFRRPHGPEHSEPPKSSKNAFRLRRTEHAQSRS